MLRSSSASGELETVLEQSVRASDTGHAGSVSSSTKSSDAVSNLAKPEKP